MSLSRWIGFSQRPGGRRICPCRTLRNVHFIDRLDVKASPQPSATQTQPERRSVNRRAIHRRRRRQPIEKKAWCERGDSNPHPLRDQILSLARLPIPPLSLFLIIRANGHGNAGPTQVSAQTWGLGQAPALPSGCEAYSRGRVISSRAYGLLSVVEWNSKTFGACSTV